MIKVLNRETGFSHYSGAPWVIKFGKLSIRKKFGYDVTVRTTVRTLRVGVSKNEFLPSPLSSREFCPLLFQKPLEMIEFCPLLFQKPDQMFGGF